MINSIWVGIVASFFTATSLLPQLLKLLREKKSSGISPLMIGILFTGLSLWIYYGFLKSDWIIIISNSIALVLNTCIGILTIKYSAVKKKTNSKR